MKLFFAAHSLLILLIGFVLSLCKSTSGRTFIVGSNYGEREDPNAVAMVQYMHDRGERVIVIGQWCSDVTTLNLARGSIRAAYHFFCSQACFFTHSLSDIIPYAHQFSFVSKCMRYPRLVFLQHGVIGLKRTLSSGVSMKKYIRSLEPTFDKMVVSSKSERDVIASFGVPAEKLAITGLPRFDFYNSSSIVKKTVLVFFTWQDATQLSAKFEEIMRSDAMKSLERQGYEVVYGVHNMQQHAGAWASQSDFQEAIRSCCLLITDDSSLAWDIFYRGQEVVFYKAADDWLLDEPYLLSRRCEKIQDLNRLVLDGVGKTSSTPISFAAFNDNRNSERVFELLGPDR